MRKQYKFNVKNILALKKLVGKYRQLTLAKINSLKEKRGGGVSEVMPKYSGFNDYSRCSVCKPIDSACEKCFWNISLGLASCLGCVKSGYYNGISQAQTPNKLLKAVKKRADYIESQLRKWNLWDEVKRSTAGEHIVVTKYKPIKRAEEY